jgi:hypothetical protein
MKQFTCFSLLIVFSLVLFVTGCGYFSQLPHSDQHSAAEQINPFEFGDEFSTPSPDVSNKTQTPARPSAPGMAGTATPVPSVERQLPSSGSGVTIPTGNIVYRIQIGGVFDNKKVADSYAQNARQKTDRPVSVEYRAPFYRVFGGDFRTQKEAEECVRTLQASGFPDARWVPVNVTAP